MGLDVYFFKTKKKELSYFRKVNFLVKYFQGKGMDVEEQKPLSLDKDMIIELLDKCNKVLKDHTLAKELLPTMKGFFFGSTEYNEYYYDDVKWVKEACEKNLLPAFDTLKDDEYIEFDIWY